MKRTFILVVAVCISLTATAQTPAEDDTTATPADVIAETDRRQHRGFVISPGVSFGITAVNTSNKALNDEIHPLKSVEPSITLGYMINEHTGIFTGASYTPMGARTTSATISTNTETTQRANFLDVPLFIRIISSRPDKIGFVADVGLSAGFLMTVNTKTKTTDLSLDQSTFHESTSDQYLNKSAVSGIFFFGVILPAGRMVHMLAGIDPHYSFTDLSNPKGVVTQNFYRGGFKLSAVIKPSRR